MKNRFRLTILLLTCCLLLSQGAMTAYAETEGSAEGGANVTQSDEMSMDNTLSSLKIAQAALSPEFSPNQLTYTATVPYEVERVALTAQTNSPDARKVIRGTSDLEVGENVITVTVTAENGSVREYRITLIRQEMPETTPVEGGETQETPGVDESDSQPETSEESVPEEPTSEEIVVVPQDTKPNGGMMVETKEDTSWDLNSLLLSPMFMIGLVGAIVLVVLIIIIVAVIALFSRGKEDDDEIDENDSHDGDVEESTAETSVMVDGDDDFEEVSEETAEIEEIPVVYNVETMEESVEEKDADDDLDDDFEMLLEDDDDFDFLDF